MRQLYKNITSIGVYDNLDNQEKNRIWLTNYIALIGIVLAVINTVLNIFSGDMHDVVAGVIICSALTSSILLNYFGKHLAARLFLIIVTMSLVTLIYCLYGITLKLEPLYLVTIVSVVLLFKRALFQNGLIGFIVIAFFFTQYYIRHYEPIFRREVYPVSNILYFLFGVLIITAIIRSVIKVNAQQKQQLQDKSQDFETALSMASHELKTPIHNISNYSDLLNFKLDKHKDIDVTSELEVLKSSSKKMYETLDNLIKVLDEAENREVSRD